MLPLCGTGVNSSVAKIMMNTKRYIRNRKAVVGRVRYPRTARTREPIDDIVVVVVQSEERVVA